MLTIGWKAGAEQYPPDELLDQALAAEDAGFDLIDVSDHFHPWSEAGQASFAWTWLGAVAARTQRIQIGPGVTCPILRYHPAIIAQAAATVECLAPGRVYLGVGTGEALNEYAATGRWPDYQERQDRLAEALALIRQLWSGEEVTFEGNYYTTRKARLFTRSNRPIPIIVSSLVPDSATFAGKDGDGLFTVGGEEPEVYREMIRAFEDGAREAGKDPREMHRFIELNVGYTHDNSAVIEDTKKYWAGTLVPALFDQNIYTPAMSAKNGAAVGEDTIKKKTTISEKAQDHIDFAREISEIGFDTLIYHTAGPDQMAFIQNFGREVIPELRELQAQVAA